MNEVAPQQGTDFRSGRQAVQANIERILRPLLARRRLVFGGPVGAGLVTAVIVLLLPARYSADASFVPQASSSAASSLMGVAAQFGVNIAGQDPTQSADFYAQLLRSPEFRRAMVAVPVPMGSATGSVALADYYDVDGSLPAEERIWRTADAMRKDFDVWVTPRTQWVQIEFRAKDPAIAAGVAARALAWVDSFNIEVRRSAAAAQVTFIEARVEDAQDSLALAENAMQYFLERNREYRASPQLSFQAARLQRRVDLLQGIVISLRTSLENARVEAVRNTSVVTVVEPVRFPPAADARRLVLKAALVGMLVFMACAASVLLEAELGLEAGWLGGFVARLWRDARVSG